MGRSGKLTLPIKTSTMFIGEYRHTFDTKNRISLPSKFRKELGASVVVTRGLDKCLFIYPKNTWKKEAQGVARHALGGAAGRGFARHLLSGAVEAEVDSAGRVLVPDYLRSFAGLSEKAVFAGVSDRIEIWDEKEWQQYITANEKNADQFAETLSASRT